MNFYFAFSLVLIVLVIIIGIYLLPSLPPELPVHWNIEGEIGIYAPSIVVIFLMPLFALGILSLFIIMPIKARQKNHIQAFRPYYDMMAVIMVVFFLLMHFTIIAIGLGYPFSMNQSIAILVALLYYYMGILLSRAKKNWIIGIRTPWTMSSSRVWDATHKLGSRVFRGIAIVTAIGFFFPEYTFWFILGPVIVSTLALIAYSYYYWKRVNV